MKRTNLALDAELLNSATTVLGVKTYSAAVNIGLKEVVRLKEIQRIPEFFGQGLWKVISLGCEKTIRGVPQRLRREDRDPG